MEKKNMNDKTQGASQFDSLEVEELTDEDLEEASGGWCSVWCCSPGDGGSSETQEIEPSSGW